MSIEETLTLGRVLERLLICIFAGVSLGFGWNLFRVGVVGQQTADLSAMGWRVTLKRVGPGIFFAIFGAAVLSLSLRSPLNLPAQGNHKDPTPDVGGRDQRKDESMIIYSRSEDPELSKSWVASINTVEHIVTKDKFASVAEQQAVERSEKSLAQLRAALLIRQFGAPMFRDYNAYEERKSLNSATVTDSDERRFAPIETWMRADRTME
jgi:hypothetical protein